MMVIFEDLAPHHRLVTVRQVGFEPHLNVGDLAVVDVKNTQVFDEDLYMIWNNSPVHGERLSIVQARLSQYENQDGPFTSVDWSYALKHPGASPFSEIGYGIEGWSRKCFGRVVGIYQPMETKEDLSSSYIQMPPELMAKGAKAKRAPRRISASSHL